MQLQSYVSLLRGSEYRHPREYWLLLLQNRVRRGHFPKYLIIGRINFHSNHKMVPLKKKKKLKIHLRHNKCIGQSRHIWVSDLDFKTLNYNKKSKLYCLVYYFNGSDYMYYRKDRTIQQNVRITYENQKQRHLRPIFISNCGLLKCF